jgi:multicomponent Na+:H+ antiporter subunit D
LTLFASPETALIISLIVPFVGALIIPFFGSWPNLRETVTLVTAANLFVAVIALVNPVFSGERPQALGLDIVPGIAFGFQVEPLGLVFGLIASLLWILNSIYSIGYMRGHDEPRQTSFYVCFAIAIGSAVGVAFAQNLFTLFIFYEILTISTYPLVTHKRDAEATRSGRLYLLLLLGSSMVLFLPAIIATWVFAGTLDFTPGGILAGTAVGSAALSTMLVLYIYGIGKAAVMPVHFWLPAAMVAPTPVSALLHAVAVVKAGVFTVMKVAVYIFGIDLLREIPATDILLYIAALTVVLASLIAMAQDNLKRRLAYSTVSQLSYIVVGALLATQLGVVGGTMQIVMHAFGKITLFFCAGAIYVAAHKTEVSELSGLGRTMPITFGAFFVGALSIIGLPPFGGLWSKWFLALGALEAHQIAIVAVLMLSSLLNIAYLLPIPLKGFFGKAPDNSGHGDDHGHANGGIHEAPLPCLIALSVTALGCLLLFFFAGPLYALADAIPLR